MGTISSIYVAPATSSNMDITSRNDEKSETTDPNNIEKNEQENGQETDNRRTSLADVGDFVTEIHLNHSFCLKDETNPQHSASRENDMGITIQYLAEENVKLVLANKQLTKEIERLKAQQLQDVPSSGSESETEIFGETVEQKVQRLQRILETERKEKWESIEKSELSRVSLVNCERELQEKDKTMTELKNELDSCKKHVASLEKRLKEAPGSEDDCNDEDHDKVPEARKAEMEKFRADLLAKREARQKALSAVSEEMKKLRDELEKERTMRRKLERELLSQKPVEIVAGEEGAVDLSIVCVKKENETLKNELDVLSDDIEKLKDLRAENTNLKGEIKHLCQEIKSLKTLILQLKNDYSEEKRLHDRTAREKQVTEDEKERSLQKIKDLEQEKEKMWEDYDREKAEINKRTMALKEVIEISRQMLVIRECQVQELKTKLKDIEEAVIEKKKLEEEGLRAEYEKQLANIKTLKELYEERVRLMEIEREKLNETIKEHTQTIEEQKGEIGNLKVQCDTFTEELDKGKTENENLERDLKISIARSKDFENELALINNLFTQMLLGQYNTGNETDLDKLTELLQENHELITDMTSREDSTEIACALPKLLLDLITQVNANDPAVQLDLRKAEEKKTDIMAESTDTISEQSEGLLEENWGAVLPILSYKNATVFKNSMQINQQPKPIEGNVDESVSEKNSEAINPTVQEIASNLPKVWKVLMELLSHHTTAEGHAPTEEKQCYKYVETPSGTRSVISVSNTFLRLKDLILEKKSLQKELSTLKQLNSHLEGRLGDQEKRLSQVQCELHKTWGIVGRMRAQHQQLHNHEKILRYELQEKRVMLSELKQELEYCREKWERARQKNNESETEWKKLRREFSARKAKGYLASALNDSAESGFSDEQNESGEEAENFDADRSSTQSPIEGQFRTRNVHHVQETDIAENVNDNASASASVSASASASESEETNAEQVSDQPDVATPLFENEREAVAGSSTGAIARVHTESDPSRDARAIRLRRLEDQCQLLVQKVDITTHKSNFLSNRLEELHVHYGQDGNSSEAATVSPLNQTNDTTSINELSQVASAEGSSSIPDPLDIKCAKVDKVENVETYSSEMVNIQPMAYSNINAEGSLPQKDETPQKPQRTFEEILKAREERLKRLEANCHSLVGKVTNTVQKSNHLSNKLEEIHEEYLAYEATKEGNSQSPMSSKPEEEESDDAGEGACALVKDATVGLEHPGRNDSSVGNENKKSPGDELYLVPRMGVIYEENETLMAGTLETPSMIGKEKRLEMLEDQCQPLVGTATIIEQKNDNPPQKLGELYKDCQLNETMESERDQNGFTLEEKQTQPLQRLEASQILIHAVATDHQSETQKETREERMQRLENECRALTEKATKVIQKSENLSLRLQDVHEDYISHEESNSDRGHTNQTLADKRAERLRLLEEQCCSVLKKLRNTLDKSKGLSIPLEGTDSSEIGHESLNTTCTGDTSPGRLQELEIQCDELVGKVSNTVQRSNKVFEKLDKIDEDLLSSKETETTTVSSADNHCDSLDNNEHSIAGSDNRSSLIQDPRNEYIKRVANDSEGLLENVANILQRSDELSNKFEEIQAECVNRKIAKTKNREEVTQEDSSSVIDRISQTCLQRLETDCFSLMENIKNTLQKSNEILDKLEEVHTEYLCYEAAKNV